MTFGKLHWLHSMCLLDGRLVSLPAWQGSPDELGRFTKSHLWLVVKSCEAAFWAAAHVIINKRLSRPLQGGCIDASGHLHV